LSKPKILLAHVQKKGGGSGQPSIAEKISKKN